MGNGKVAVLLQQRLNEGYFEMWLGKKTKGQRATGGKARIWTAGTLTYSVSGIVVLFAWLLLGDFAWSMRDRSIAPMSQWYLGSIGVPNYLFALLLSSFPALVGLLLVPVISVRSDRHRGRLGRRIPFLLVTTPIGALGMVGLGLTPVFAHWLHAFLTEGPSAQWLQRTLGSQPSGEWLLAALGNEMVVSVFCFAIFWAAFEFATIVGLAIFGGLVNDVVPRPLLGRFYGLFRVVSLIDGIIFNYWIMGKVPTHFTLITVVIGVFYGLVFMLVCLKVKEGAYPPPPPPPPKMPWPQGVATGVRRYFKECFTNRYYLLVFVMLMTAAICFLPLNTFTIPYATSLGVTMEAFGKAQSLTFGISLCLAYFLGWLADVFHPLRMVIVALTGYLLVTLWGAFFVGSEQTFLIGWVLHGVMSGTYFTCAASLGQRLFPHERYAQFASAGGICISVATMTLSPILGIFIDAGSIGFRYVFFTAIILTLIALVAALLVFRRFMQLGGPEGYVAPEA